MTLLAIHSNFVNWILELEMSIVGFHICWEEMDNGEQHLFAIAELVQDSEVDIDVKFFDKIRLGGNPDA